MSSNWKCPTSLKLKRGGWEGQGGGKLERRVGRGGIDWETGRWE